MSLANKNREKRNRKNHRDMIVYKCIKDIQSGKKIKDLDMSELDDASVEKVMKFYRKNENNIGGFYI